MPTSTTIAANGTGNTYLSLINDITGDGKAETVWLTTDSNFVTTLHVNNATAVVPGDNPQGYFGIVKLNNQDPITEIAVSDLGPSDDYTTTFYYYDGNNIIPMGTTQGLYEDMKFDGKGTVTTLTRGKMLDTWFYPDEFSLTPNRSLTHVPKDFYTRDTLVTMLHELSVQASPTSSQIVGKLKKNEKATITRCDDKKWCEITGAKGERGWFAVEDYDVIVGTGGLHGGDVFDGLSYAD